MKDLVEGFDWAATPLGPRENWPPALKLTVDLMSESAAQIVLFAGSQMIAIYNSAYAPTIGDKHPHAFGRAASEGWAELWEDLGPLLQQVRDTGETLAAKDRLFRITRHGFNEEVYFDISFSPVREPDGSVCAVLCIVSETTCRVRAVADLARREEQLRSLLSQAHIGIVVAHPDGTIRAVNAHFTAMTGYVEADLRGTKISDIMSHPSSAPSLDGREEQLRCKDGHFIWVARSDGQILDDKGQVSQIGMIFSDVTARRQQEADMRRLAAIIGSSDDAILGTDLDMHITNWNEGAARLYGYEAHEVIGRSVLILVPSDRQWEEQRILSRIRAGGRVQSHETIRRHRDGHMIDVSLTVSPIFDESGAVVGASKIARNISERRVAEKMQRVLVDEMKHRVKNILATVHAIARQTFAHVQTPQTEAFEARLFALSRAQDLITRETLDHVDLAQLIREVMAPYATGAVSIEGPALALSARAALSLTLGFHELATNAAKYGALSTAQGRVAISWRVEPADPPVFTLRWEETGGPPVTRPERRGFGSSLVRMVVPAEIDGQAELDYAPSGLVWEVRAPLGDWGQLPLPSEPRIPNLLEDEA